jgi:PhnB protein
MVFYQQCLGGKLFFQTIGESPLCENMPKKAKDLIIHASLTNGNLLLMGSDMASETGLIRGNAVALTLNPGSEKELKSCYKKLSEGGQVTHPLQETYWGAIFGALTDKFGNHWLLNYHQVQTGN